MFPLKTQEGELQKNKNDFFKTNITSAILNDFKKKIKLKTIITN